MPPDSNEAAPRSGLFIAGRLPNGQSAWDIYVRGLTPEIYTAWLTKSDKT